jgi:four helix bundle protein
MATTVKSFTDLEVYQECRKFRKTISALTKSHFPPEEKTRLTDQILRSSRGITNCIAEGYGRFYHKENIQFCRMSRGSLMETLDHLITAYDEKYIDAERLKNLKMNIDSCGRLLNGYINYLKKTKPPKDEKSTNAPPNNQ